VIHEVAPRGQSYDWPGNIRELQNVIERAVIIADSDTLAIEDQSVADRQASLQVGVATAQFVEP
jgi:DNA-binding NtrC family response regulator